MTWRLIDVDPFSGRQTWHTWDAEKKQNVLDYRYPVENRQASLDHSAALRNDSDYSKGGIKKEWWHVAHIPDEVMMKWHAMGVDINDPQELGKMAQKPEWRKVLVTDGKF